MSRYCNKRGKCVKLYKKSKELLDRQRIERKKKNPSWLEMGRKGSEGVGGVCMEEEEPELSWHKPGIQHHYLAHIPSGSWSHHFLPSSAHVTSLLVQPSLQTIKSLNGIHSHRPRNTERQNLFLSIPRTSQDAQQKKSKNIPW